MFVPEFYCCLVGTWFFGLMVKVFGLWCPKYVAMLGQESQQAVNKSQGNTSAQLLSASKQRLKKFKFVDMWKDNLLLLKDDTQLFFFILWVFYERYFCMLPSTPLGGPNRCLSLKCAWTVVEISRYLLACTEDRKSIMIEF